MRNRTRLGESIVELVLCAVSAVADVVGNALLDLSEIGLHIRPIRLRHIHCDLDRNRSWKIGGIVSNTQAVRNRLTRGRKSLDIHVRIFMLPKSDRRSIGMRCTARSGGRVASLIRLARDRERVTLRELLLCERRSEAAIAIPEEREGTVAKLVRRAPMTPASPSSRCEPGRRHHARTPSRGAGPVGPSDAADSRPPPASAVHRRRARWCGLDRAP